MNSVNSDPGGSAATAWPQCMFNSFGFSNPAPTTLMGKLQAVFNAHSANHCGNAQTNIGLMQALIIGSIQGAFPEPSAIISHGSYMYAQTSTRVVQFKMTVDPVLGLSNYASRTYATGLPSFPTGLGIADDLKSLMTCGETNGLDFVLDKFPLCQDIP